MEPVSEFKRVIEEGKQPFGKVVYVIQTGSRAYGLSIEGKSDYDAKAVFTPSDHFLLGLGVCEQIKVMGDDWVAHDVRQYVKLCLKMNPSMLETLFIESPLLETNEFRYLRLELRKLITKEAFKPYSAYIRSQLAKGKNRQPCMKRKALIEAHGVDTKFMSHCARLAVQGIALMQTGYIPVKVPEPYRTEILAIKTGLVQRDDIFSYCEDLDKKLHDAYKSSTLPDTVDLARFEREIYIPFIRSLI